MGLAEVFLPSPHLAPGGKKVGPRLTFCAREVSTPAPILESAAMPQNEYIERWTKQYVPPAV
jgi:hypothetical protein